MDNLDLCDGGCGRELGVIRHTVEVEDGICIVCQKCFKQRQQEIAIQENQAFEMTGLFDSRKHRLPSQRGNRGKGRIRV